MFVGSQIFPNSWGHNFVGRKLGVILIHKKMVVSTFMGMLIRGQGLGL